MFSVCWKGRLNQLFSPISDIMSLIFWCGDVSHINGTLKQWQFSNFPLLNHDLQKKVTMMSRLRKTILRALCKYREDNFQKKTGKQWKFDYWISAFAMMFSAADVSNGNWNKYRFLSYGACLNHDLQKKVIMNKGLRKTIVIV